MISEGEEKDAYTEEPRYDEAPGEEDDDWQGHELILAALGMKGPQEHSPLQLTGNFKGQQVKMLIDGGSAVNWISSNLSEVLQLEVIKQKPITVTLPNGVQVTSQLKCDSFKWNYENHSFETAVWLMELKEWDVILGVEWLAQLGDLKCNYSDKSLQFIWNKQQVTITPTSQVEILGAIHQLSVVTPLWMEQIISSYEGDTDVEEIITKEAIDTSGPQEYYLNQGLLQFRGKWVLGRKNGLRRQVFTELHNNGIGGHSGIRASCKRVMEYFYWSTIRQDIGQWVRECSICQQTKGEKVKSPGLLKPLDIPQEPWRDLAMDFVTGLPKSKGHEVI